MMVALLVVLYSPATRSHVSQIRNGDIHVNTWDPENYKGIVCFSNFTVFRKIDIATSEVS